MEESINDIHCALNSVCNEFYYMKNIKTKQGNPLLRGHWHGKQI